ncbi:hypothetical protein OKW29_002879 [Paraburkholderia sp. CI3]
MADTIVGVDIAKNVMQVHWVNPDTGDCEPGDQERGVS